MESLTISFDTQQVVLWQSQAAEFKACPCYTLNIDKTLAFFIYVNYGFCCSWKSLYYIDQGGKHTRMHTLNTGVTQQCLFPLYSCHSRSGKISPSGKNHCTESLWAYEDKSRILAIHRSINTMPFALHNIPKLRNSETTTHSEQSHMVP